MTNKQQYDEIFTTTFEVDHDQLNENLTYNSIPNWDSVGHMELIAAIEEAFDISMETDDIIDFNAYLKGIEILKKYDVEIQ
jgi:acyl carrier protein